MKYVEFDMSKPLDFIPIGRIAIDFNPTDMYMPLSESSNFNKYVGGSPANIAVGLARLGCKVGFCGCVSNDQFGDFVVNYFEKEGIDTSHVTRAKNGECIGLTFTEILSKEKSSILMYRDNVYREARRSMSNAENVKIFFRGVNDTESVKKRYRALLKIYHPDNMNGDNDLVLAINEEYERLLRFYLGT